MTKLFIGNLPKSMDATGVRKLFKKHGSERAFEILRDQEYLERINRGRKVAEFERKTQRSTKNLPKVRIVLLDDAGDYKERVHSKAAGVFELNGFAMEFQSTGQPIIDPEKFSKALHIQIQDLAQTAGVHRATVSENPSNTKLQGYLRDAVRAMSAAFELTRDRDRTLFWFRNSPISEFGHQTAEHLVAAGKTDAVIAYLQSIASGSSG